MNPLINFFAILLVFSLPAWSQVIFGYVYDNQNTPLPGVNVYINQSNQGTTTNSEGYYSLNLPAGEQTVIFSFIGFVNDTVAIHPGTRERISKNIHLREHALEGEAIYAFARQYNDAQEIVRKTIENKNAYLSSIKNYEYDAYHKTVFHLQARNDRQLMGGLVETISKGFFRHPDQFEEVVLAKRQSKNFSSLTNVFTVGKIPNLLEETITLDELTVISPLSRRALEYYHFEMIDTTYLNQRMVFNMTFEPKGKTIALFSGSMSIIDQDFAVVSCTLDGGNRVVTKIRDQIQIDQKFRQYENKFWFPTLMIMHSRINLDLPGIPYLYWRQEGLISNYRINIDDFAHHFDNTLLSYAHLSDAEKEALWNNEQIIPLNQEEKTGLAHIDSVISNTGFIKKSVLWTMQNFDRILISGFYDFYHYNRVQGHYLGIGIDTRRYYESMHFRIRLGYGLKDQRFNYDLQAQQEFFSGKSNLSLRVKDRLVFADRLYRYNPTDITTQTLFGKNDYADYLYEKGISIGAGHQFANYFKLQIEWNRLDHRQAPNNTKWALFNREKTFRQMFPATEGIFNTLELKWAADNLKYFDYGWLMAPDMSQNFYDIQLRYLISKDQLLKTSQNFERYHLYFSIYHKFPPWLHLYLRFSGGYLTGRPPVQFLFHLAGAYGSFGNPILFRTIDSDRFLGKRYGAIALENNFKNALFSLLRLPYLKQSKLDFLVFANAGWIDNRGYRIGAFDGPLLNTQPLTEAGFSVGNLFTFLRLDFTWRLHPESDQNFNVRLTSRLFIR